MSSPKPPTPDSAEVQAVIAALASWASRTLATDSDVAEAVDGVHEARVAYDAFVTRARAQPEDAGGGDGMQVARAMEHLENLLDVAEEHVSGAFFRQGITRFRNRTGYRILGHAVRKMRLAGGGHLSLRTVATRVEELARATGDYDEFKLPHSRLALMETAPEETRQRIDHLALVAEACGFQMRILFEPSAPNSQQVPHALLERAWGAMSSDEREMFYLLLRPLASRDRRPPSEEAP